MNLKEARNSPVQFFLDSDIDNNILVELCLHICICSPSMTLTLEMHSSFFCLWKLEPTSSSFKTSIFKFKPRTSSRTGLTVTAYNDYVADPKNVHKIICMLLNQVSYSGYFVLAFFQNSNTFLLLARTTVGSEVYGTS